MPYGDSKGWSVRMQAHQRRQQYAERMEATRVERNRMANAKHEAEVADKPPAPKPPAPVAPKEQPPDPVNSMSNKDLRTQIERRGLSVPPTTARARLIEIYREKKDLPFVDKITEEA